MNRAPLELQSGPSADISPDGATRRIRSSRPRVRAGWSS
jgi:hypothetical protein